MSLNILTTLFVSNKVNNQTEGTANTHINTYNFSWSFKWRFVFTSNCVDAVLGLTFATGQSVATVELNDGITRLKH